MDCLTEIYEPEWPGHDQIPVKSQALQIYYEDLCHKLNDQVTIPLSTYLSQFSEIKVSLKLTQININQINKLLGPCERVKIFITLYTDENSHTEKEDVWALNSTRHLHFTLNNCSLNTPLSLSLSLSLSHFASRPKLPNAGVNLWTMMELVIQWSLLKIKQAKRMKLK